MEVPSQVREAGAALFAVDPTSFKSLNGTDGAVYMCRRGDRAHVIKFIPMDETRLSRWRERQDFIHYLAAGGVNIACPLPSVNGALWERLEVDGRLYVVIFMPMASGRAVEVRYPEWGPAYFEQWGRTLGQMHALARQYPLWQREETDAVIAAMDPAAVDEHMTDWRMDFATFQTWCQEPEIVKHWLPLKEKLSALPVQRDSYGVIHNDLHQWNFLYQEKAGGAALTIIDFDVCGYNWFLADLAIALYHAMLNGGGDTAESRMAFAQRFLPPFRRGYERANLLDGWWWAEINTFLKYRQIVVYVAHTELWPEGKRPAWQISFLGKMRRAILSGKPVLPEAYTRTL